VASTAVLVAHDIGAVGGIWLLRRCGDGTCHRRLADVGQARAKEERQQRRCSTPQAARLDQREHADDTVGPCAAGDTVCLPGRNGWASEQGLLSRVAPALSAAGVPLVIGMQLTARIGAATRASGVIYRALAAGHNLQDAVGQTRQALFVEEADRASWYLPALYIRSRDTGPTYLVAPHAPATLPNTLPSVAPARRGARQAIVAHGGSCVRNVTQQGRAGSDQKISAESKGLVADSQQRAVQDSAQENPRRRRRGNRRSPG
jgi:hypothetical protein